MATFQYKAKDKAGKTLAGVLEAPDRAAAVRQLERQGLTPVAVTAGGTVATAGGPARPRATFTLFSGRKPRMGMRDVLIFSTELSDLLASGMTLGNALGTLANRKSGKASDVILRELRDDIINGSSLSDALARHPETFSPLYVSMVRVGEASGALSEVMSRLVEHYERLQEVKEKVIMALVYPAIVVLLGILTLIFAMVYVIPKFSAIFRELGQALPLPTRMLIGLSTAVVHYGWAVAVVIGLLATFVHRAIKTPQGRMWWHGLQLRIPLIRGIIAASTFANFARTLATLLSNGVPALQALGIVEQTVGNVVIAAEIRKARERVTDGTTISGPLAAGKIFPPLMTDMLAVGEQTGDISGALQHIARRYESELTRSVKVFTTALEPALIVLVAIGVGFVAISILMAVFNLTSGLNV